MHGLYLVTDRALCGDRTVEDVVLAAVRGGVSYVQLREKELSTRLFIRAGIQDQGDPDPPGRAPDHQ